jgi:hypothetical protein
MAVLRKPEQLPEDYLLACAAELARRHQQREEALRKIGFLLDETPKHLEVVR